MAKIFNHKRFDMLSKVKTAYTHIYPSDSLGKEIGPNLTFARLLCGMQNGDDVYIMLGVSDSIVRERIFNILAVLSGLKVSDIYDLWNRQDELREMYIEQYIPF